ncbi:NADPH:quinone oxidoreductase [Mesorhizobium sp. L-8-3]|nr:NADPH:quinone oxidoreductase [Mesorhizobium sp. L-8-3]
MGFFAMKAILFSRFDGPDALEVVDVQKPLPGRGEVLVRVRASGINFFETLMLRNRYAVTPDLPIIPGVEIAGEIEAVGDDVRTPEVGTRVAVPMFAVGRGAGGYAEYVAVEASSAVPLPDGLSFEDAVALLVQGLTALHLIRRSNPTGKTVLVNAAAGGVGSLVVQLAAGAGATRVIAAASSAEKLELARSLGAHVGVDYTHPDWADQVREINGGGVDIVYEMIGGAHTKASLAALAPRGELAFGALGRFDLAPADLEAMFSANQSIKGFALLPLLNANSLKADLAGLFRRGADGTLKLLPASPFPLERASEAHRAMESRRSTGKLVLIP